MTSARKIRKMRARQPSVFWQGINLGRRWFTPLGKPWGGSHKGWRRIVNWSSVRVICKGSAKARVNR